MYSELTRPLNDRERQCLLDSIQSTSAPVTVGGTLVAVGAGTGGIALCVLLFLSLTWLVRWPILLGLVAAVLGIVAVLCLYFAIQSVESHIHWSRHHRTFIKTTLPSLRAALEDARVAIKHVVARAVIEILEFEDEGQGYLFDVGDTQVLFLKGQQYDPENERDPWPNSEFDIVRTLHGDHWLGIFCYGTLLEPVRSIAGEDLRDEYVWESREELRHGTLDELERAICHGAETADIHNFHRVE